MKTVNRSDPQRAVESRRIGFSGPKGTLHWPFIPNNATPLAANISHSLKKKEKEKGAIIKRCGLFWWRRNPPVPDAKNAAADANWRSGGIYKRHKRGGDANPVPLATIIV